MENDGYDNRGAGANLNTDDDVTVTFLPLVDSERKLLHIHFLSAQEVSTYITPVAANFLSPLSLTNDILIFFKISHIELWSEFFILLHFFGLWKGGNH